MVKAAIGEAQTPGGDRGRLDRQTLIGGPTVVQIECTECAGEEAELHVTFQTCLRTGGVIANSAPRRRQAIRELNACTILHANTRKALENRDGHRIRCDHLLHARAEDCAEQVSGGGGGGGKTAINGLRRDRDIDACRYLGEVLNRGSWVGKPAIDQGLH